MTEALARGLPNFCFLGELWLGRDYRLISSCRPGVDLSPNSVTAATKHAVANKVVNVQYKAASAYSLPSENELFEAVVSSDVIEHIVRWNI